jgi:hypothetical protein
MTFRRPMPPELLALGDVLEAAAERAVARRRARRTQLLQGVATVAVALPLAITAVVGNLGGTGAGAAAIGRGIPAAAPIGATVPAFVLPSAYIRDESATSTQPVRIACLDGKECRIPEPFFLESPMGKV